MKNKTKPSRCLVSLSLWGRGHVKCTTKFLPGMSFFNSTLDLFPSQNMHQDVEFHFKSKAKYLKDTAFLKLS
jgi:hypothetical protein